MGSRRALCALALFSVLASSCGLVAGLGDYGLAPEAGADAAAEGNPTDAKLDGGSDGRDGTVDAREGAADGLADSSTDGLDSTVDSGADGPLEVGSDAPADSSVVDTAEACTRLTCADYSGQCGLLSDGCGGTLSCNCAMADVCLDAGNLRGNCCTPLAFCGMPVMCGFMSDGCGSFVDCTLMCTQAGFICHWNGACSTCFGAGIACMMGTDCCSGNCVANSCS